MFSTDVPRAAITHPAAEASKAPGLGAPGAPVVYASLRISSTRFVSSQVNPGSFRPKWP